MVCLVLEPWEAGWKVQMNQLRYGGTPFYVILVGNFVMKQ